MKKTLYINSVDFSSYFPDGGYTVTYNKISGSNEGRMLNGSWTEDIIAVEAVVTLPVLPLTEEQQETLLSTIYSSDYVALQYFDPKEMSDRTIQARYETSETKHRGTGSTGNEYWSGIKITFTENVQ